MASYNTVPDLESEAQPLIAAPPRKLGKTLAVVALFGFAAGAATATAAPHVAAKMNFAIMSTAGGVETGPCTGSDCIYNKGGTVKTPGEADSGLDIDGSATDGATTGDQFQINTNGAVTTQGADLPEGGETTGVVENDETPKNGQGVGGVYIPARM